MPQPFSDFLTSHKNAKPEEFYKALGSYLEPIFSVTPDNLNDFLITHINMIKKTVDPFDKTAAAEIINNDSIIKACVNTIEVGWHTHNLKIPNAQVAGIAGLLANDSVINAPENYPHYFTAHNQPLEKKYAVVGNAAYTCQAKLMTLEFIINDKTVCVAEQLIQDDSPVQNAFIQIGLQVEPLKKLQAAIEKRLQYPTRADIDSNNKQIAFPIGNGQYHCITPAQHSGLAREFVNRLKAINNAEHQFINYRSLKVGGTNAINAGVLNVEIGGAQRHLLAIPPPPPPTRKSIARLFNQLAFHGTALFTQNLNTSYLEAIRNDQANNQRIRLQRHGAINALLQQLLHPAHQLRDFFQENSSELEQTRFQQLDELEKHWLCSYSLARKQREKLAQKIDSVFRSHCKLMLNDTEQAILADCLAAQMQEY